jgi:acetyl-CoA C-acetyltransferase
MTSPQRLDPRTPVLVAAGQVSVDEDAPDPVHLIAAAARAAAPSKTLRGIDSIRLVRIVSRGYPDPGRLLAAELGAAPRETIYTHHGGHNPQRLITEAAYDIFTGRSDLVLVGGGESWRTRRAMKKRGITPDWLSQDASCAPTRVVGDKLALHSDAEQAIGFGDPLHAYPLIEVARRAHEGLLADDHLRQICELWARFSQVAAENPFARIPKSFSAEEIARVSPTNRLVAHPYRKLLVANDDVNQAAALILCSVERAEREGIPRDRWVFLHGAGAANEPSFVSNRVALARAPAIADAGRQAFEQAGVGVDDLKYIDLYSCFPCAVEIAAAELGIGLDRDVTVTGGLTFAGGPWNNYTSHAVATMWQRLTEDPGAFGMCTANGGLLTKHAIGIYSTQVPRSQPVPVEATSGPERQADPDYEGSAAMEAFTVMYDADGCPTQAFVACLTPHERRVLVSTTSECLMSQLLDEEPVGSEVRVGDHLLVGL